MFYQISREGSERDDAKLSGRGSERSKKFSRKYKHLSKLIVDKRMSARLTRSKAKQRTKMSVSDAKLDAVLANMDDLLAAKVEIERHSAEVGDFGNKSEENRSRCQII